MRFGVISHAGRVLGSSRVGLGESPHTGGEVLQAGTIRHVVEEEEAFLDSHLTLQEVACRCGTSRAKIGEIAAMTKQLLK